MQINNFINKVEEIKKAQKNWLFDHETLNCKSLESSIQEAEKNVLHTDLFKPNIVQEQGNNFKRRSHKLIHGLSVQDYKECAAALLDLYEISQSSELRKKQLVPFLQLGKNWFEYGLSTDWLSAAAKRMNEGKVDEYWETDCELTRKHFKKSSYLSLLFQKAIRDPEACIDLGIERYGEIKWEQLFKKLKNRQSSTLFIRRKFYFWLQKLIIQAGVKSQDRETITALKKGVEVLSKASRIKKIVSEEQSSAFYNKNRKVPGYFKTEDISEKFLEAVRKKAIERKVFHFKYSKGDGFKKVLAISNKFFIELFFDKNSDLWNQVQLLFLKPDMGYLSLVADSNIASQQLILISAARAAMQQIASHPKIISYLRANECIAIDCMLRKNPKVYQGLQMMFPASLDRFFEIMRNAVTCVNEDLFFAERRIQSNTSQVGQEEKNIEGLAQAVSWRLELADRLIKDWRQFDGLMQKTGSQSRVRLDAYRMRKMLQRVVAGQLLGIKVSWPLGKKILTSAVFDKFRKKFPEFYLLENLFEQVELNKEGKFFDGPATIQKKEFMERMLQGEWNLIRAAIGGHKSISVLNHLPQEMIDHALSKKEEEPGAVQKVFYWLSVYFQERYSFPNTKEEADLLVNSLQGLKKQTVSYLNDSQKELLDSWVRQISVTERIKEIAPLDPSGSIKPSNLFKSLEVKDLFNILNQITVETFVNIPVWELDEKFKDGQSPLHLRKSIELSNLITRYLSMRILSESDPKKYAACLKKLIQIGLSAKKKP